MRTRTKLCIGWMVAILLAGAASAQTASPGTARVVRTLNASERMSIASLPVGGGDLGAALAERGLSLQSLAHASELSLQTADGTSYSAYALETPVAHDEVTVVIAVATVPDVIADQLAAQGVSAVWLGIALHIDARGERPRADVSLLGARNAALARMAQQPTLGADALTDNPCVQCVLDLLTGFACEAAATAISCSAFVTCPGAVMSEVVKGLLLSVGTNACTQFDIRECAAKCGLATVTGTPAAGALLKPGVIPITVKATSPSPFDLGGVWFYARKEDSLLPDVAGAAPGLGRTVEQTFSTWKATPGRWTLVYGAIPIQTFGAMPSTTSVTVQVQEDRFSIGGNAGVANASLAFSNSTTVPAGSNGRYELGNLPAGSYTVTPSKSSCRFSPSSRTVKVGPSVADADFTANCTVYAISGNAGGAGVTVSVGGKSVLSDSTGKYTIADLVPGSYAVTAAKSGCAITPNSIAVQLGPNATGKDFRASCKAPAVEYTVSGNTGASGVTVTVGSRAVSSDASGNFTVARLTAGTYKVVPQKPGCSFQPVTLTVVLGPSATTQNFKATCR